MNGGSNDRSDAGLVVIERWKVSLVSSFDQLKSSGIDRTLSESGPNFGCQRLVNSREVPKRLFHDRTHPVSADQTLNSEVTEL